VLCSDSISQSDIDIEKPVLVNTESHSIRLQSVSPKLSSKGQRHFSTSASTTIQTLWRSTPTFEMLASISAIKKYASENLCPI
jgi:hypothetical protein